MAGTMDPPQSKTPPMRKFAKSKAQLFSDPAIPSSSPAFGTPALPIVPPKEKPAIPAPLFKPNSNAVLSVQLPPATLRPIAFRIFTRKNNLTLQTPALNELAVFVGKHCGAQWKKDSLADGVLEEAAKMWKKQCPTKSIVTLDDGHLKTILKTIEGCMSGGKIVSSKGLSRQSSFALSTTSASDGDSIRPALRTSDSFGVSKLAMADDEDDEDVLKDPREWCKVINAFEQPRMLYNFSKKHFERAKDKASLFPPPSHRIELFRQRYHVTQQRVLRNSGFHQNPIAGTSHRKDAPPNKLTLIANLLGRSNSFHLLLGMLIQLPTGTLALADLTGSIQLDLQNAQPSPDSIWVCPGMVLLVEGTYVEDGTGMTESSLGNLGGIGGTIGGKFQARVVALPPAEPRSTTLAIQDGPGAPVSAAFGWTDFLGLGSEKATGPRMRSLQRRIMGPSAPHAENTKVVLASEVTLDQPTTLSAVRKLLSHYAAQPAAQTPLAFVFMGNFISQPALTPVPGSSSIDYKELFNLLAQVLSDFPTLIARTSLVFVPGTHDAWASSFSAGAAVPLPAKPVPDMFTSRIRRAVVDANREMRGKQKSAKEGEVIWTTNPSRLTWFGCAGEMVLFRDDISGRFRRSAVHFTPPQDDDAGDGADAMQVDGETQDMQMADATPQVDPDVVAARRLTQTICDQGHLAPFPLSVRPVHWDYGNVLQLYPLPTALVVADAEAPAFAIRYSGCCVMNPARLVEGRRGEGVCWIEYDVMKGMGEVKRL